MTNTNDTASVAAAGLLAVLGVPVLLFGAIVYSAWAWAVVAGDVFGWFIHPMFPHLIAPSLAQFIAIGMLVSVVWRHPIGPSLTDEQKSKPRWVSQFVHIFARPWIVWAAVWVVSKIFQPLPYVVVS